MISSSSKLQEMLKNPNKTLEDILDEDILTSEFKDAKPHVLD